jgi:hypothetical protein
MNERLTELYRACRTEEALATQDEYKTANVLLGSEVEKFAELIVRECAEVADLADENKCEWIGGNILTRFGVEE